jgi:hypothetical protein
MANTEGMSDEFVESLAVATTGNLSALDRATKTGKIMSSSSSVSSIITDPFALERQRLRLQNRLDLPMGETPAAKVSRPSSTIRKGVAIGSIGSHVRFKDDSRKGGRDMKDSTSRRRDTAPDSLSRDSNEITNTLQPVHVPLVGNIVEHDMTVSGRNNNNNRLSGGTTNKVSRFAQRNRLSENGFPSLDVPLGTFVKTGNNSGTSTKRRLTPSSDVIPNISEMMGSKQPSTMTRSNDLSVNDLSEISKKDAQAMLESLSLDEIKQYQEEVTSALSPGLLSFLKSRGKNAARAMPSNGSLRAEQSSSLIRQETETTKSLDSLGPQVETERIHNGKNGEATASEVERRDKERIAKLVASVKSHEDLDAAFHAEMQQLHPLELLKDEKEKLNNNRRSNEEFQVACDLLRSTSPRQALWAARIVCLKLEEMARERVQSKSLPSKVTSKPNLPVVLSVSLRCLLDKPLTTTCLLHTYALQSLHFLTIIFAHSDHVISVIPTINMTVDACIFQETFLEDAVPTPPLKEAYPPMAVKPLSVQETGNEVRVVTDGSETDVPVAYSASSSTTSAVSDGQAFESDPMWTLLSQMRILPRLSFLLLNVDAIPVEASVAVCGLLTMIGQRSPGAATAIVKHETLLLKVVSGAHQHAQEARMFDSDSQERVTHDIVTFATMRLLCILARQSRVAAQGLSLEDILPPLLVTEASSDVEFRSQQLALILWRTVLRYGIGLEALASMITISARHLVLPHTNQYSLSVEFLSSFNQVLECVQVGRSKTPEDITSLKGTDETKTIKPQTVIILSTSTKYMASTIRPILPASLVTPSVLEDENWILKFRWNAARLQYLSTWCQLLDQSIVLADTPNPEDLSSDNIDQILLALGTMVEVDADVDKAWRLISLINQSEFNGNVNLELEAAACAFLLGFMSIALAIGRSNAPAINVDLKSKVMKETTDRILGGFQAACSTAVDEAIHLHSNSMARAGWIIQSNFAVAKFLFYFLSKNGTVSSIDLALIRGLVFSLVGTLRMGDESIAAVLFSSDFLFQASGDPVQEDTQHMGSSPLSTMFLGELCGSERARNQLDHSFKLRHGRGLTAAGFGPFTLDTLLSEADFPAKAGSTADDEEILPVGRLWLWKSLSGSIKVSEKVVATGMGEATEVVAAILSLILEQDLAEEVMGIAGYSRSVALGSKLYYLVNVCLQPESVFSDERILESAESLLDRYLNLFGESERHILDFCHECSQHSGSDQGHRKRSDNDVDALEENEQKLFDHFVNKNEMSGSHDEIPLQQVRALENLLEDLTNAYRDYGAQYDFFTKCIRVFLLPIFPASIRCRALKELDGMFHLLTLSKESGDKAGLTKILEKTLPGGLPGIDGSKREGPDILDAVSRILEYEAESSRSVGSYMQTFCTALLVRNLAASMSERGLRTTKRRLEGLRQDVVTAICEAAATCIVRGGTKDSLVTSVMSVTSVTGGSNHKSGNIADARFVDECITQWKSSLQAT